MEPGLGYRCGICRLETLNQKSNCRHKGGSKAKHIKKISNLGSYFMFFPAAGQIKPQ
jgi:isopropylmalate/homocitrate/citramalate synthase